MTNPLIPAALAGLALVPVTAQAQSVKGEGYEINSVGNGVFEVVSEGGHGGEAFWCVAGKFTEIELKSGPETQIYVVRGEAPSETTDRRSSGQFTIDPAAAGITPAPLAEDLNAPNVGGHMSAGDARNYCADF